MAMVELFSGQTGDLPAWLDGSGPASDLVLGTRATLIRNLAGLQFPGKTAAVELQAVLEEVENAVRRQDGLQEILEDWTLHSLGELTAVQRNSLLEKLLISRQATRRAEGLYLLSSPGLDNAINFNDRDHLRLTGFSSGFNPEGAVARASRLERALENDISYAYQEDLGYLTSTPTRVGTGLVLTALLHLPGLVMVDEVDKIINALHQLRFSVAGWKGGRSSVRGALFLVSSQVTLGKDESEIQDDFKFHVGKVLTHEKTAREQLFARDPLAIQDTVFRDLAILQSARLITSQECFDRLSSLRLGLGLGLLPGISVALLNRLLLWQQSAHLSLSADGPGSPEGVQALRASFLRENLRSE
jgi:protein arginine kinase